MTSLSTHVLDSVTGTPARGMRVHLERQDDGASGFGATWATIGSGVTDDDGRARDWGEVVVVRGIYRLGFDTGAWFDAAGRDCFYPEVLVTFRVDEDRHYHVPLLLAPYAYSTYRGS
jgi:5-hydroxyisourate hydrolase